MPETLVTEAIEAAGTATPAGGGLFLIDLITPGWGSSGHYAAPVLEQAATDRVFPAGTQMFINHQTAQERNDRPEGDLRELAAVLVEDAAWTGESLQAKARVFSPWRPVLDEMKEAIGVSIRASAEIEFGDAEGRNGRIIGRLVEAQSVDFVTRAGRGGRIVEVLEAARDDLNRSAVRHGVDEATVNDQREALSELLKATYGGEGTYVWLRDFDESTCWFEVESPDEAKTWQQSYTTNDDDLPDALTGDPIEVRQVTTYVPVSPAGQPNTQESKEDTMPDIEEARLRQLEEDAGRVTALESERDEAVTERDEAREQLAEARQAVRESTVARIIAEADADFSDLEAAGLQRAAESHTTDGVLDEDAFQTAVNEAVAAKQAADGAGRVRGNGQRGNPDGDPISEADLDALDDAVFGEIKEA